MTVDQSRGSSSASTWAIPALTPWPISAPGVMRVMLLSAPKTTKTFTVAAVAIARVLWGKLKPMRKPPAAAAPAIRKPRRLTLMRRSGSAWPEAARMSFRIESSRGVIVMAPPGYWPVICLMAARMRG